MAKPRTGRVTRRSCRVIQGAIPSVIRFQRPKAPRFSERRDPSRDRNQNESLGRRCGRVQAREWASIPSRTHRRRQEELEREVRRDHGAQAASVRTRSRGRAAFTFALLFRPARFSCPADPLERRRSRGREFSDSRGLGLEPRRRRNRVARCGDRARVFFASKRGRRGQREERIDRGNVRRAIPCSARGPRSQNRARVSYFENSVAEVEKLRLAQGSACINPIRGREREPSRRNRAKARNRGDERAQCPARWRQNQRKPSKSHDGTPFQSRAASVARRKSKKRFFSMKVVSDRNAVKSSRASLRGDLGAGSNAWAAAEGSASWREREGATGTTSVR